MRLSISRVAKYGHNFDLYISPTSEMLQDFVISRYLQGWIEKPVWVECSPFNQTSYCHAAWLTYGHIHPWFCNITIMFSFSSTRRKLLTALSSFRSYSPLSSRLPYSLWQSTRPLRCILVDGLSCRAKLSWKPSSRFKDCLLFRSRFNHVIL